MFTKLMTWLWVFVIVHLILGGLLNQSLSSEIDEVLYFTEASAIPLIILSVATWIHLGTLYFATWIMRDTPPGSLLFPRLWGSAPDTETLKYQWEKLSAFLVLALPLAFFTYFWIRFFRHTAYVKSSVIEAELADKLALCGWIGKTDGFALSTPGEEISLWAIANPCLVFRGWDIHRYGRSVSESVSYLPFWQPLMLMTLPTFIILIWTAVLAWRLKQRAPLRHASLAPH